MAKYNEIMRTEKEVNLCIMMMLNVQTASNLSLCCKIRATKNANVQLELLYNTFSIYSEIIV